MLFGGLCDADDERAPGRFNDIVGDDRQTIDFKNAPDLHEEPVKQAKVAAGDACDGGDGLGVGEIGFVNGETELSPMARQNEGEFVALQLSLIHI